MPTSGNTGRTLADIHAEAVVVMAGIVRLEDGLQANCMSHTERCEVGRRIAGLKAEYFALETLHRRLASRQH